MLNFKKNFSVLVALTFVLSVGGCDRKNSESNSGNLIQIGEVTTLSGTEASFGVSSHRGVELAIKEINEAGGVRGKMLEVITLDDSGKAESAVIAVTKLVTKYRVSALTGALPSSRGIAIAPVAQKFGVPMVSSASTHPAVTQFGDFIYRTCFIDPFQGDVMARFALEKLKIKKVAILKDIKSDYSVGLAENFIRTFTKKGGEILVNQTYGSGDIDFKAQLTAIRSKAPQAVFIPGYYTEGALIARQARELGLTIPLLGGDGWDAPQFVQIGQEAVDNSYFSTHYSSDDKSPQVQRFVSKFRETYDSLPDGLATLGYDGVYVLVDAMRRAKELNSKGIRDALAATRDFVGVTGKFRFDQYRNPVKSAVVLKIENGKSRYMSTISPE